MALTCVEIALAAAAAVLGECSENAQSISANASHDNAAADRLCALTSRAKRLCSQRVALSQSPVTVLSAFWSCDRACGVLRGKDGRLITARDGQHVCLSHPRSLSRTAAFQLLTRASVCFAHALVLCVMCSRLTIQTVMRMATQTCEGTCSFLTTKAYKSTHCALVIGSNDSFGLIRQVT